MKSTCPVEGYEDCFVEFTDAWSRKDIREFRDQSGTPYIEFLKGKITDVFIRTLSMTIDSKEKLTEESIDDMDWQVFQWFSVAPGLKVSEVLSLGEATRRLLSGTPASTTTPEQQTP